MFKNKKILAIIPARGGSKGLPRKNIKPLLGKPLVYWTIKEAKKSVYLDRVIVSTDSQKIAAISKRYGAEVPFLRPKRLSMDNASSEDVIIHAVEFFRKKGDNFDIFVLLQPTSPLRKHSDIDEAIKAIFRKKAKVIVSVSEVSHSPLWMNVLAPGGCMKNFLPADITGKNRQSLPRYFMPNGAVFAGLVSHIEKTKRLYGEGAYAYIMPRERSVDIDDIIDFGLAETLLKAHKS